MARGPIRGVRRLTKRAAGFLPLAVGERGKGQTLTDAEHALVNLSVAFLEELQTEIDKPKGQRDVARMLQIEKRIYEWVEAMRDREATQKAAAEAKARGEQPAGGDAAAPGGADPYGALGAFTRRPEGGVGA